MHRLALSDGEAAAAVYDEREYSAARSDAGPAGAVAISRLLVLGSGFGMGFSPVHTTFVVVSEPGRPCQVVGHRGGPRRRVPPRAEAGEKEAKMARKMGQLQLFTAVFPQE